MSSNSLRFDPEYYTATEPGRHVPPPPKQTSVLGLREANDKLLLTLVGNIPFPEGLTKTVFPITSHDGAQIQVTRFASDEVLSSTEPTSAVVYVHGGGFVSGSVDIFSFMVARHARASHVPFFAVSYRLAPEFPAPCGVRDVFAAVRHISAHAAQWNVDPARIAIMGDSAGGGIAAGTALYARDHGLSPPLAKQILVYPMLDDATELPDDAPLAQFISWKSSDNVLAWDAYVGADKRGRPDADVPIYAAPARARDLRGLPPTYMDIGTLDLFRDENVAYVTQLLRDHVEVEFHLMPGLPHGFDGVDSISWSTRAGANRLAAVQSIGK